jgi:hypothetical protein
MTDPIEAVARALRRRHDWADRADIPEWWMDDARAAIAEFLDAVREPSDGMKHSGTEFLYGEDFVENPAAVTTAVETWQAMIDTLRAELLPPPGDGG